MNKIFKSLVIVWFAGLARPVYAQQIFNSNNTIENIYLGNAEKRAEAKEKAASLERKKNRLPRLKRLYVAGYGGYFYSQNDMAFTDSQNCSMYIYTDSVCNPDKSDRPIDVELKDEFFFTGAFGVNSRGPFRIELAYYELAKKLKIEGSNMIGIDRKTYNSDIDLRGGSVNLYVDFAINRQKSKFILIPYVMAGIGISDIDLNDITYKGPSGQDVKVVGKSQNNKTIIYGAGITTGLNNYISLDIGYRYYDFGKIETSNETIETTADPLNPTIIHDLQLETDFDAHIGIVGIKIQI